MSFTPMIIYTQCNVYDTLVYMYYDISSHVS